MAELDFSDFFEQLLNERDPGRKDRLELLRPASAPTTPSETLLRPAQGNPEVKPEELLRASKKK